MRRDNERFELIVIAALQVFIAFCLYVALRPERDSIISDETFVEFKTLERINKLLDANSNKANELAVKGRHREAAILSFQGAAARECFLQNQKSNPNVPSVSELMALRRFEKLGTEQEPYKQILLWKYPGWRDKEIFKRTETLSADTIKVDSMRN